MKKILSMALFVSLIVVAGAVSAWSAVTYPHIIFTGIADTTATVGDVPGNLNITAMVTDVYYSATEAAHTPAEDSVIGMYVTITGASRTTGSEYAFTDATIAVGDGTHDLLVASLTDINFIFTGALSRLNPGLSSSNPSTLNMRNIYLFRDDINYPSRFVTDVEGKIANINVLGMKMDILGDIAGTNTGLNISTGLIDGVPEGINHPLTVRSTGYWKNHEDEKSFFNYYVFSENLVSLDIFSTESALDVALNKKGKKNMKEKAEQQFAALLLNLSASVSGTAVLKTGELEILQLLNPVYSSTATLNDAVFEIENALRNNVLLENAKDLGDEINNRDHGSN
ncbi:hypothetical protein H8E50_10130 [bacterium]|nr:hypothetical protein [bacterium]